MSIFFGLDCLTNGDVTELRLSSPEPCEFNRASQSTNIAHQKHHYDTIGIHCWSSQVQQGDVNLTERTRGKEK